MIATSPYPEFRPQRRGLYLRPRCVRRREKRLTQAQMQRIWDRLCA